jgi:hypothetical protein
MFWRILFLSFNIWTLNTPGWLKSNVRYENSDSVCVWHWRYFQQQSEAVMGSCNELCDHMKVQWPSPKHCDWGNTLWTTWWISPCQYTTISGSCIHLTLGVSHHRTLCVLLTSLNTRKGGRNWPAALQHAITVLFSLLSHDVKTLTLLELFFLSLWCQVCYLFACHFRQSWKCS